MGFNMRELEKIIKTIEIMKNKAKYISTFFTVMFLASFVSTGSSQWSTSGTIEYTMGKVGIGTDQPSKELEIKGGIIKINGPTSDGGPMLMFKADPNSNYSADWAIECVPPSQGHPGLNIWKPFGSPNWNNNYLFLAESGNVGVHTNSPTASLTVNGQLLVGDPSIVTSLPAGCRLYVQDGILAERIKVALTSSTNWSWPDYVFQPGYQLKNLKDVEEYINTNNHLPDVPSSSEIKESGIDIGEMNAKLLSKVEELTLYVIQLRKDIDSLKSSSKNH